MEIPKELRPGDGRFGSGPSKVRSESLAALAASGARLMGTSHRQPPILNLVGDIQSKVAELFSIPAGYEVVLGVGGSTAFWDAAAFSLIRKRSQHLVHGEFSAKFARAATAPHLDEPHIIESEWNTRPVPVAQEGVDVYAWAHNETSTGVMNPVQRIGTEGDLVLVDATSGAGGLRVDIGQSDVYYFAPQKSFASDGGLWFAIMSPAAIDRAFEIKANGRYIPAFLDVSIAIENSRKQQTLNTPAVATLFLMDQQLDWMLSNGGLEWAAARSEKSAHHIYNWAQEHELMTPFVSNAADRSTVVTTIDVAEVKASDISQALRENSIVDIDGYRGLGRNQLRIATFPTIDPEDVAKLTECIDFVVDKFS